MRTPEEIYDTCKLSENETIKNRTIDAMANYALQFQEHTFDFAEWISRHRTDFIFNGRGYWHNKNQLTLTTRELYNEFLNGTQGEIIYTKKDYI